MVVRVKKRKEYWWNIIYGGLVAFIIMFGVGYFILVKLNFEYVINYYFIFCLIIVVYCQWNDDNYSWVNSKFSKSENGEIVKNVLENLNWRYKVYPTAIQVTHKQNLLAFLNVCIIPSDDKIYFNFQYRSFVLLGRLPFYLGILTIAHKKFQRNLQMEIAQESQVLQDFEFERSRN